MGVRVPTSKSLVLINTSIYRFIPGMGKKVSTSCSGLGVKDNTPSMRVYTHSMSVVTASNLMASYTSMNLTCTVLGVRVSSPSMVVCSNSM